MASPLEEAPLGLNIPIKPCLDGEGVNPDGVDNALMPGNTSVRGLFPGWLPPVESDRDLSDALVPLMSGAGRSPVPFVRSFSLSLSFSRSFFARARCLASACRRDRATRSLWQV